MTPILCWKCGRLAEPYVYHKHDRTFTARYCHDCHLEEQRIRNTQRQEERKSARLADREGRHLEQPVKAQRATHCTTCGKKRAAYNRHPTLCFACEERRTDERLVAARQKALSRGVAASQDK